MKFVSYFLMCSFLCTVGVAQNFSVSDMTFDLGGFPPPGDDILFPGPAPILPGTFMGGIDVDAFSYGRTGSIGSNYYFSVDFGSLGLAGSAVDFEVLSGGMGEQNVDVFRTNVVTTPFTNFQVHDGDGVGPGGTAFSLGLSEPAFPTLNPFGTGVDGYDTRPSPPPPSGPADIFWSWDPFSGLPPPLSLSPADVMSSPTIPGYSAAGVIFASSFALGLDFVGPDNIDALEVYDSGVAGIYDTGDVILFSLDPASASLGMFGGATPGDVLIATFGGPTVILWTGADLGLAAGDNLTALSVVVPEPTSAVVLLLLATGLIRRKR